MKIRIKKDDILSVLPRVQSITNRKTNLAITETVLIKTIDSGICLTATDLETGFEGFYPAIVESEGSIALNAKIFYEIVKEFPMDEISIVEIENRRVKIGDKNVEYHIVGMDPQDFPEIPKIENIDFFEIDSQNFKKMIERTVMIAPMGDDKRAHLIGVYFEKLEVGNEKLVRMVSTDGGRLVKVDYLFAEDKILPDIQNVIVPKKGLNEIGKFLEVDKPVKIGINNDKFIAKKENETIIIRLLEGIFPEYGEIIDNIEGETIKVDKKPFLMMLKRMSILSSPNYKAAIFSFGDGKLIISHSNPDFGDAKEDMNINFEGEKRNIPFNPKYFIDALNVIENDVINLNIKDHESPCIIEGEGNKNFLSVIMPMQV
ncbi:MAG: DNA polymerase III subunit beta [Desulfobacterales bacterium]|nr:DNA polymerase III subunit beta [Desulfobacterales bacterium]MBF0397232.1 DNA polymerase III subunit beta [Desulfobacterales bacterium]